MSSSGSRHIRLRLKPKLSFGAGLEMGGNQARLKPMLKKASLDPGSLGIASDPSSEPGLDLDFLFPLV